MYLFKNYSEEMEEIDKCKLLELTEKVFGIVDEDYEEENSKVTA